VWFVSLSASPLPGTDDFAKFGGAQVNCWLAMEESEALSRATELLNGYGWRVEHIEHSRETQHSEYVVGSEGLRYFEQALADGEAIVFHTWSNEASDRGSSN
jgi:hypothetical protein